jgi:threonine synthase
LTEGDHDLVKKWMTTVDQTAKLDLDSSWVEKMRKSYESARVTDDEMCSVMRKVLADFDYFADPHTCIALAGGEQLGYKLDGESFDPPAALLATASPCKFEESVTVALGEEGWEAYTAKSFPPKATEIMAKDEVLPVTYESVDGKPLAEVQAGWEVQATALVAKLAAGEV